MCGRYLFLPDEQIEEIKNILQRINQKFYGTPFLDKLNQGLLPKMALLFL